MPDQQTSTQCLLRLVALRGLSPATPLQCQALRAEAGRRWTTLVSWHAQARAGAVKAQVSAKRYRQQRALLRQAARTVGDCCHAEGVKQIAVGDVHDLQTGVSLGKVSNQKSSQWPHGQFTRYLTEKAARLGMVVEWIAEAYSTRTCRHRGHVQPSSPRGRRLRCLGGGARVHRDVNGSATICSKAAHGVYSKVQADTVKYLRPIGGAPLTRATSR